MSEQVAARNWHVRAIVRVIVTTRKGSVDPWRQRTFNAGEELEALQWGYAGKPVERPYWWTSYDVDAAFIFNSDEVEIVRVLDEVTPFA